MEYPARHWSRIRPRHPPRQTHRPIVGEVHPKADHSARTSILPATAASAIADRITRWVSRPVGRMRLCLSWSVSSALLPRHRPRHLHLPHLASQGGIPRRLARDTPGAICIHGAPSRTVSGVSGWRWSGVLLRLRCCGSRFRGNRDRRLRGFRSRGRGRHRFDRCRRRGPLGGGRRKQWLVGLPRTRGRTSRFLRMLRRPVAVLLAAGSRM